VSSLPPIADLTDPGPLAQWAGIVVTCVGTGLGLAGLIFAIKASWDAANAAKNAQNASERAAVAAAEARDAAFRAAAVFELQNLLDELADLRGRCGTVELPEIEQRIARLAPRLRVAAAPLTGGGAESIIRASAELSASSSILYKRVADSTKRADLAEQLAAVCDRVADVQSDLRSETSRD